MFWNDQIHLASAMLQFNLPLAPSIAIVPKYYGLIVSHSGAFETVY